MFRFAKSSRRILASAVVLVLGAAVPAAAQVTYDDTRTITECTIHLKSSCATLSIRTFDLASGGSHVSIGVTNLQGSSPYDNTGGTLLTAMGFNLGQSAGSSSTTASLIGNPSGFGAYGTVSMSLNAGGTGISLAAPFSQVVTHETAAVPDQYSVCVSRIGVYCTSYNTWTGGHQVAYTDTVTYEAGIYGQIPRRDPAIIKTNTGDTRLTAYVQDEPDYLINCSVFDLTCHCPDNGFGSFDRTCHYPVYDLYEIPVSSEVYNTSTYYFNAMGKTSNASDSFLFSFDSPNLYNAADVTSAWFDSDSEYDPGETYVCDPRHAPSGCHIYTNELTNNPFSVPVAPVVATPEPASLALLATGLLSLAAYHRRRRAGTAVRD